MNYISVLLLNIVCIIVIYTTLKYYNQATKKIESFFNFIDFNKTDTHRDSNTEVVKDIKIWLHDQKCLNDNVIKSNDLIVSQLSDKIVELVVNKNDVTKNSTNLSRNWADPYLYENFITLVLLAITFGMSFFLSIMCYYYQKHIDSINEAGEFNILLKKLEHHHNVILDSQNIFKDQLSIVNDVIQHTVLLLDNYAVLINAYEKVSLERGLETVKLINDLGFATIWKNEMCKVNIIKDFISYQIVEKKLFGQVSIYRAEFSDRLVSCVSVFLKSTELYAYILKGLIPDKLNLKAHSDLMSSIFYVYIKYFDETSINMDLSRLPNKVLNFSNSSISIVNQIIDNIDHILEKMKKAENTVIIYNKYSDANFLLKSISNLLEKEYSICTNEFNTNLSSDSIKLKGVTELNKMIMENPNQFINVPVVSQFNF